MRNVLLTNDDGIEAEGLQALRRTLLGIEELLARINATLRRSSTMKSACVVSWTARPLMPSRKSSESEMESAMP